MLVSFQHTLDILLEDLSLLLLWQPSLRELFERFVTIGQEDNIQQQRRSEESAEDRIAAQRCSDGGQRFACLLEHLRDLRWFQRLNLHGSRENEVCWLCLILLTA